MKVISTNEHQFFIYENGVKVFDELPCGYYTINFNNNTGFFLETYSELTFKEGEQKLYGPHESKIKKIIASYKRCKNNLGVILSGEKGLGKSLTAKLIAKRLYMEQYPIIIVNRYIEGIANFLHKISTDCVILFDEFDKLFKNSRDSEDKSANPQEELLSLFDGMDDKHRLFVITANDIYKINEFLINRPGRFQYHLIFQYPSYDDINVYMRDNLNDINQYKEIPSVQNFSTKVPLSYDALRAICFELNGGLTFKEAIDDLNIININLESYNVRVTFINGFILTGEIKLDLFSTNTERLWLSNSLMEVNAEFCPSDLTYSINGLILDASKLNILWSTADSYRELNFDDIKNEQIESVRFARKIKNYRYNI